MELEVGIFIRTPLGIDKIIYLRKQDEYGCNYDTQLEHNLFINNEREHISIDGECFEKEEIKTSYNIIDILEVGDYVNGYIVEEIKRGYDGKIWIDNSTRGYDDGGEYTIWKRNEDIKSVITHEQMEQMAYKVGEE